MRDAPAVEIAHFLQNEGAYVKAHDPVTMRSARKLLPGPACCEDPYEAAKGADALILVSEWNEYRQLDMPWIAGSMRQAILFDTRNVYDPRMMKAAGFTYRGVVRSCDASGPEQ
jgi:UDPglucose 6-dehydrogenase